MKSSDIKFVIENFNALLPEEKELAVDIIFKAYTEKARKAILLKARKEKNNLKKGNVKKGSSNDLFSDLEID